MAKMNGRVSTLTVEDLHRAAEPYFRDGDDGKQMTTKFSVMDRIKMSFEDVSGEHVRGLFATARLAYSTSLIIIICECCGWTLSLVKWSTASS